MGYQEISFEPSTVFLVTGGAGFIGSNLCEALLGKGCIVRCLDNLSTGKEENMNTFRSHPNFSFCFGDIREMDTCRKACDGVDYVLHQAAWGSVPKSIELPLLYKEINISGTLNMLEAARRCKVKKFVYASSSSVYGAAARLPKVEGQEGELLSPYALTKRAGEEYAKLYTRLYELGTIGLRYFNVFGRRQDTDSNYAAVIPKFIKQLLNNQPPVLQGDGTQSRDFTYIENVIEANLKACKASSEAAGQVFNIAYGEQISLIEAYGILCKLLDKDIKPDYEPMRKGDIKHSYADISKAKALLNYAPDWSFRQGMKEAISWYRVN